MAYHDGEIAVQARAGVRDLADRVGRIIRAEIPPVAGAFLRERHFVIVTTVAGDGAVTTSLLGGSGGFVDTPDQTTIVITPSAGHRSIVARDIRDTGVIGLLAIDFPTRRRMRVNGTALLRGDAIVVSTREVYANCPQYIHDHHVVNPAKENDAAVVTAALDDRQRRWIESSDTFFIGSIHPAAGADASHRGGPPGFVSAEPNRVTWPDFSGNNMFNTLGNLAVHPRAGLLFVDFESGATLQLQGRAQILGHTERAIQFDIDRVLETVNR